MRIRSLELLVPIKNNCSDDCECKITLLPPTMAFSARPLLIALIPSCKAVALAHEYESRLTLGPERPKKNEILFANIA